MAKITLSEPDGPYQCVLDAGVMQVEICDAFLGVHFVTEGGEKLSVSMRDNGFEVHYAGHFGEKGFDAGWVEFKDSHIRRRNGQTVG